MSFEGYSTRFQGFETVEDYCRADCENSELSDDQKRLCVQGCVLTEAEYFPAMTTEPRPAGPGQGLRDELANLGCGWFLGADADDGYRTADAILATIEAAGLSIVASDVLERVVLELREVNQSCDGLMFLSQEDVESIGWVHPNCTGDMVAGGDR